MEFQAQFAQLALLTQDVAWQAAEKLEPDWMEPLSAEKQRQLHHLKAQAQLALQAPDASKRSALPPEWHESQGAALAILDRVPALRDWRLALLDRLLAMWGWVPTLRDRVLALQDRAPALQDRAMALQDRAPALQERALAPMERALAALEPTLAALSRRFALPPVEPPDSLMQRPAGSASMAQTCYPSLRPGAASTANAAVAQVAEVSELRLEQPEQPQEPQRQTLQPPPQARELFSVALPSLQEPPQREQYPAKSTPVQLRHDLRDPLSSRPARWHDLPCANSLHGLSLDLGQPLRQATSA